MLGRPAGQRGGRPAGQRGTGLPLRPAPARGPGQWSWKGRASTAPEPSAPPAAFWEHQIGSASTVQGGSSYDMYACVFVVIWLQEPLPCLYCHSTSIGDFRYLGSCLVWAKGSRRRMLPGEPGEGRPPAAEGLIGLEVDRYVSGISACLRLCCGATCCSGATSCRDGAVAWLSATCCKAWRGVCNLISLPFRCCAVWCRVWVLTRFR